MGMIIVTGGAGFIGSCIVRMLNDRGYKDIVIVDNIQRTEKWRFLTNKEYTEYIPRDEFLRRLPSFSGKISNIIHMGACSATTERDFDFLLQNNLRYTQQLWTFCADQKISFIYASSAATYGSGEQGFDDQKDIKLLRPLNGYGYSKQMFDLWAEKQAVSPAQHVGLKFFNVYGPNEYYKGSMASVVFHAFNKINDLGKMELFKSYNSHFEDGRQLRDFIYVKDICKAIAYFLEHKDVSGLFNLGTGTARSFYDLCLATFHAMDIQPKIDYIEMPMELQSKYQYYTQAEVCKLRVSGYRESFYTLEDGVTDYVTNYLMKGSAIY